VNKTDWKNTIFINSAEAIEKLKHSDGPDLQVWGSSKLIQLLLKHDLADELQLKIFPLTLGSGKKLFEAGTIPAAFTLLECTATPSGVILASYKRSGDIKTGTVGA
jgi:dihydrofolate reductase